MPEGPRHLHRPRLGRSLALALWLLAGCAGVRIRTARQFPEALDLPTATGAAAPNLAGKVVLVQFFATWCFPCLAAFEQLEVVNEHVHAQDFAVVAVGMDLEGREVLAPFVETYKPGFPVLVAGDALRAGQTPFGKITQLPATYLLDRDGHPLAAFAGVASEAEVEAMVKKALQR